MVVGHLFGWKSVEILLGRRKKPARGMKKECERWVDSPSSFIFTIRFGLRLSLGVHLNTPRRSTESLVGEVSLLLESVGLTVDKVLRCAAGIHEAVCVMCVTGVACSVSFHGKLVRDKGDQRDWDEDDEGMALQ